MTQYKLIVHILQIILTRVPAESLAQRLSLCLQKMAIGKSRAEMPPEDRGDGGER